MPRSGPCTGLFFRGTHVRTVHGRGRRLSAPAGWASYNRLHWLEGGLPDFCRFFWGEALSEPHSTKQLEDILAWSADVTPQALQRMIEKAASVPLNGPPNVQLEELSGDTVTMSIRAVPLNPADGPKLSSDILAAVRDSDLDGRPDAFDLPTDP